MAPALCASARLASRRGRGLSWFLDRDQAQGKRRPLLGAYPDRAIDQAACSCLAQQGYEIDRTAFGIAPPSALPASPDHKIRAGLEEPCHAARLQIGAIGKADLARNHRNPVERLARPLIGQFEVAKAFLRKIERAVNAPQLILPGARSFLRYRGGIDDADQATSARLRASGSKHPAYQQSQPVPALTQAVKQSHIGDIDKADRCRPGRRQSQSPLAQTVRQDQPQQIHRIADLARTHKGLRLACRNVEALYPTKTDDNARPVPVQKRFVSHSMLESQAIRRCNHILAPMGESRDPYAVTYRLERGRRRHRIHGHSWLWAPAFAGATLTKTPRFP